MLPLRIGRPAIGQLVSTSSLLQRVKLVSRVIGDSSSSTTVPIRPRLTDCSSGIWHRGFATEASASRPKAHTGRATTRKKASNLTTTKKATKKVVKKAPKKRGTAKKVSKRAVKKAKKPRVKKVLSPEDKQKQRIRALRVKALNPPHGLPATAWTVVVSEVTKSSSGLVGGAKEASAKYKNLLPEEREHYNHIANQNKAKNKAAHKSWVESFTPDQIRLANNARLQLRRITKRGRSWTQIQDDRQIKRPATARILFSKDRWASGDFNGMKVTDVPSLLTREWNALSAQKKKTYEDRYAQARKEYEAERSRVYGTAAKSTRQARAAKDSAAASA